MVRQHDAVRTTVDIDDDLLDGLRSLARAQGRSLGSVVSELLRRALTPEPTRLGTGPGGFPTFEPPRDMGPLTIVTVRTALDDEP